MLREYSSKPSKVLAEIIVEEGTLTELKKGTYEYKHKGAGASSTLLVFTANKKPVVGDAIIWQSKKDIYHCPKDVFDGKYGPTARVVG